MSFQFKQTKQDEYYTKENAVLPILKYIPKDAVVWCPFDKSFSNYVKLLEERGNKVIYSHIEDGKDFFENVPFKSIYLCSRILPEKIIFENIN